MWHSQPIIAMDFHLKMRRGSENKKPWHIQFIFQVHRKKSATCCFGMHVDRKPKEYRKWSHMPLTFKQTVVWHTASKHHSTPTVGFYTVSKHFTIKSFLMNSTIGLWSSVMFDINKGFLSTMAWYSSTNHWLSLLCGRWSSLLLGV